MIRLILILLMFLFCGAAFATNIGNGPAVFAVWQFGVIIAFVIAIVRSGQPKCSDDSVDWHLFRKSLFILLPIVFVLGIASFVVFR